MRFRESSSPPSPAGPVYICIRHTLDWQDEALVEACLIKEFRPKVQVWNATFDLPYHAFRHRLTLIARRSLAGVENAACAPFAEIPRGAVVVPVDDDDWLSPDLANRIRERYEPAIKGYHWIPRVIELPRCTTLRSWLRRWRQPSVRCATNNYAVANFSELAPLVFDHMKASRYFGEHRPQIKRIANTLSVQNRNMASQTAMAWKQPSITRDELVASFHRYQTFYESLRLGPELRWARPYVDAMAELMQQVHVK